MEKIKKIQSGSDPGLDNITLQIESYEQSNKDLCKIENRIDNLMNTAAGVMTMSKKIIDYLENVVENSKSFEAETLLDNARMNHYQLVMNHFHSSINADDNQIDIKKQDLLDIKKTVLTINSKNNENKNKILKDINKSLAVLDHNKSTKMNYFTEVTNVQQHFDLESDF